ncbi:hypothetical protein Tco_0673247, partial [Tanacetum coccineum]
EEKPADTLGDAGRKVQQEIGKEFTAMVTSGTVHVTECCRHAFLVNLRYALDPFYLGVP